MDRIGKYESLSPLGHGAAGEVFKAFDPVIGRNVAIKLLTDSVEEKELARFRLEAKAAGKLHHRNVVSIFEFGVDQGRPYLVMELLEGVDLAHSHTPGEPMPLWPAVEIMHQVAHGLQHAHTHGVVHRDVSPNNIWLMPDGTVKLIDFGIARNLQGAATLHDADQLLGTLLYLSPEHLADPAVALDARADIFSFGSVFYELVAGQHPFAGTDDLETVCGIQMRDPEPVQNLRPGCPEGLSMLIQRALSKDLELRYQSFQELLMDLDPLLIDLRQQEAEVLFKKAQTDFSEERIEEAKAGLGKVLELSHERKDARELLEKITRSQRESAVRKKVEEVLAAGRACLAERRFREGIDILERARRLDSANAEVSGALAEARSGLRRHEKCVSLLQKAEQERRTGALRVALQSGQTALESDPDDQDAVRFVASVGLELEAERRKKVSEGLAEARKLLSAGEFGQAVRFLQSLHEQIPDSREIEILLAYAQDQSTAVNRRKAVEKARAEAIRSAAFGDFAGARRVLGEVIREYPDDPEINRLIAAVTANMTGRGLAEPGGAPTAGGDGTRCTCGNILKPGMKFCDRCGTSTRTNL